MVLKFLKNRFDSLCSFLAKNSLPLPLSPFRKTNDSVLIIFFKLAKVFFEQSDLANIIIMLYFYKYCLYEILNHNFLMPF